MPDDETGRPPLPPYLAIAADLRGRIENGELAPGDMVPSITRLSQEHDVSRNTAVKALRVLASEGLTYRVAGWGTFVRER